MSIMGDNLLPNGLAYFLLWFDQPHLGRTHVVQFAGIHIWIGCVWDDFTQVGK